MKTVLAAFGGAAMANLVATPIVRRLGIRFHAVSVPGGRHVHREPIPRLGGIGLCLSFIAPLAALLFVESSVAENLRQEHVRAIGLVVGAVIMCILGVVDDMRGVRASTKFLVQIGVALLAFSCGFRIDAIYLPFFRNISMGIFALPITVLWTVGIINAINLIDGLDGLAAGVTVFAALTNFVVAYLSGNNFVALMMASILGSVLAFLIFNFNPARIFMGDSGSYFLGYVLAATSLVCNAQRASTTVAILVPILALGVPIFDTLLAMARRIIERRPIFSADRGHIHHRLLNMGITHRRAVLILYGACLALAAAAIAVSLGRSWQIGAALLAASAVLVGLVRFVGYFTYFRNIRLGNARTRSALTERIRRLVPPALAKLAAASTDAQLFDVLRTTVREMALISAQVGGVNLQLFSWREASAPLGSPALSIAFPLENATDDAEVRFSWEAEDEVVPPEVDVMLQLVVDVLAAKLMEFNSPVFVTRVDSKSAPHGDLGRPSPAAVLGAPTSRA